MSLDPEAADHPLHPSVTRLVDSTVALMDRIHSDPGLPRPNPSKSFWQNTPNQIGAIQHPIELPTRADIVIIGSGISAAAVTRTLLSSSIPIGKDGLNILVLEARKLCTGATGQNGGHIKASTYIEYQSVKKKFGVEKAQKIIEFRKRHLYEMMKVAKEEGIKRECEIEEVEGVDVFFDMESWQKHQDYLLEYIEDRGVGDEWVYRMWRDEEIQRVPYDIHIMSLPPKLQ